MNNFNEVFSKILNEYQKTGSLEDALKVLNLTPEQKTRIQKAFQTLDSIEANAKSLREAKEEGISRKNWLAQQIMNTAKAKKMSEKQTENAFAELSNTIAKISDNIAKKD